jgi:hypothetical protein
MFDLNGISVPKRCTEKVHDTYTIPNLLTILKRHDFCSTPTTRTNEEGNQVALTDEERILPCKNALAQSSSGNSAIDFHKLMSDLTPGILQTLQWLGVFTYTQLISYCHQILDTEKEGALLLLNQTPEDLDAERNVYLQRGGYAKSFNGWVVFIQLVLLLMLILTIGFIRFKGGELDAIRTGMVLAIPLVIFLYGWFFISGYTIL